MSGSSFLLFLAAGNTLLDFDPELAVTCWRQTGEGDIVTTSGAMSAASQVWTARKREAQCPVISSSCLTREESQKHLAGRFQ
jgi:hypothetical protein